MRILKNPSSNTNVGFVLDNELGFDELKALKLSLTIAGNTLKKGIERENDKLVLIKDKMNHGIATLNDMNDQMEKITVYKTQQKYNDALMKKLKSI